MSLRCVIYIPHCRIAIGVSVPSGSYWCRGRIIYISAWGLCVARFDKQGNILGASNREASDSAGLHVFFMSESSIISYKNQGCRSPKPYKTLLQSEL